MLSFLEADPATAMLWCTHLLVEQLSSYSDDSPPRRELYLVAAVAGTESARLFPTAGRPSTRAARQRACAVSPWPLTKRTFVFAALPPPWTGPANSGATASRSGLIAGARALMRTTESRLQSTHDLGHTSLIRRLSGTPPPVAAPSTLFVDSRRPPAPLLAGALRRAWELVVYPRPSHPFVQDPPSPIRRRQQLAWHRPRPRPRDRN